LGVKKDAKCFLGSKTEGVVLMCLKRDEHKMACKYHLSNEGRKQAAKEKKKYALRKEKEKRKKEN